MNGILRIYGILFLVTAIMSYAIFSMASTPDTPPGSAPIVVELFTSQSCSSCPPADKLLGELASQPDVITLSCHVTYWDHLNWKDTLSQQFCTQRQRSYAAARQTDKVYTPQMIVNGREAFVGSRKKEAQSAINDARKHPQTLPITITPSEEGWNIALPKLKKLGKYEIIAFVTRDAYTQNIPSGENRGKTIHYHSAALQKISLGPWGGTAQTHSLKRNKITTDQPDSIVIITQTAPAGPILAAGKISVK